MITSLSAFAQSKKPVELAIFEVDSAERGLEGFDHGAEGVDLLGVDVDVEHVDVGELLEEHALAFHHRLAGQRPDVAQSQHGRAIGDHAHQVAACGVAEGPTGTRFTIARLRR